MAKTYGELMVEYENYQYSKECYELTKECYELELMAQYIESQQFISENISDIKSRYQEFNESYFVESVSNEDIAGFMEAAEEKSKNTFNTLWKGIKAFFKKAKKFFFRIFGIYTKTTEKKKDFIDKLTNGNLIIGGTTVTPEILYRSGITKKLSECWKSEYKEAGFVLSNNQPFTNNIRKIFGNIGKEDMNILAAALSTDSIKVNPVGIEVITYGNLTYVFNELSKINENSNDKTTDLKRYINAAINTSASKGIEIDLDDESIKKAQSQMEEIYNKIEGMLAESTEIDLDIFFTEASKNQRKREKKEAQKAAGGAVARKGQKMGFEEFKNKKFTAPSAEDIKSISNNIAALNDIYKITMAVGSKLMKLYSIIVDYTKSTLDVFLNADINGSTSTSQTTPTEA